MKKKVFSKLAAVILSAAMVFSMIGCGSKEEGSGSATTPAAETGSDQTTDGADATGTTDGEKLKIAMVLPDGKHK